MNGEIYKEGDKLICLPGFTTRDDGKDRGGSGYKKDFVGTVASISNTSHEPDSKVYWFRENSGRGIYGQALKLYQEEPVINNSYSIF